MTKVVPLRTSPVRDIISFLEEVEHDIINLCLVAELPTEDDEISFVIAATDGEMCTDTICTAEEYFASKRRRRAKEYINEEEDF